MAQQNHDIWTDGMDFASWSHRFINVNAMPANLKDIFLTDAGTPTERTTANDKKRIITANAMLISALPEDKIHHVKNVADAHNLPNVRDMWKKLENSQHNQSYAGLQAARKLIDSTKLGNMTVEQYQSKLQTLITRYNAQAGKRSIPEEEKLSIFLAGLPPWWETFNSN